MSRFPREAGNEAALDSTRIVGEESDLVPSYARSRYQNRVF